jgi:hypothetical protein
LFSVALVPYPVCTLNLVKDLYPEGIVGAGDDGRGGEKFGSSFHFSDMFLSLLF